MAVCYHRSLNKVDPFEFKSGLLKSFETENDFRDFNCESGFALWTKTKLQVKKAFFIGLLQTCRHASSIHFQLGHEGIAAMTNFIGFSFIHKSGTTCRWPYSQLALAVDGSCPAFVCERVQKKSVNFIALWWKNYPWSFLPRLSMDNFSSQSF